MLRLIPHQLVFFCLFLLLVDLVCFGSASTLESARQSPLEPTHNNKQLNHEHFHFNHEQNLPCDRPWPTLTLFLPLRILEETHPRAHEWEEIFMKSFLFFWPHSYAKTKLMILLDEEQTKGSKEIESQYQTFKDQIAHYNATETSMSKAPTSKLSISIKTSNNSSYHSHHRDDNEKHYDYDQQQLSMLYVDKYIDESESEFVGFVDTDCQFVTYIDREDLFEDGNKPVIHGRIGPVPDWRWYYTPLATKKFLGLDEPMRCAMSYYPVILKTRHIQEMRVYIENLHDGKSLQKMIHETKGKYSIFSFMCTYIWYFHREEYVWYVSDTDPTYDLSSKFKILSEGRTSQWVDPPIGIVTNKSAIFINKHVIRSSPKPRVAIRYISKGEDEETETMNIHEIVKRGYCISPPFPNLYCDLNQLLKVSDVFSSLISLTIDQFYANVTDPAHTHAHAHPPFEIVATMPYMHHFEDANYWSIYPMQELRIQGIKRYHRLKNCVHTWDYSLYNMSAFPLKIGD
jgi:hypothetical protein